MKKRNISLVVLAAAMVAACTSDSLSLQDSTPQAGDKALTPVNFSAYAKRGLTRSGATGPLTLNNLKTGEGFGVFAYYTNAADYASDARPNFMFNEQVKWNDTYQLFDYSPVRYWPNEYGEDAHSEDIDKVSFFAYTPYVEVNPTTGYLADPGELSEKTTWGITATSRNTYTGDPIVKYITSFEQDKTVDLCWGVYNEGTNGWTIMNGGQTITNGLPWLNVQRSGTIEQRLKFTFLHATAQLNVQIDANVDGGGTATELGTHYGTGNSSADPVVDPTTDAAGTTKIYVRSISFTGIAAQGALNLNNVKANTPLWMNYTGTGWIENGQSVTVHDGLRDGYEGTSNAEANSETMRGLNPHLISNEGNTSEGVTNTPRNLFGKADPETPLATGVYVIPTGERVRMTIVYDVETAVGDLSGYLSDGKTHGTSIENRITTDLMYDGKALTFEGGKSYTLRLHLGMNSVKFDADVNETWTEGAVIDVPRSDISLSTISQADIDNNRGTEANPRAWVICEEGELHLCQGGTEVNPSSDPENAEYLAETGKLSCGHNKVAVVCYVGKAGSVDKSETVDASGFRGLALALEDATSDAVAWYTDNSNSCVSVCTIDVGKEITTTPSVGNEGWLKGIDNTNQLGQSTGDCTSHTHEAAEQALNYIQQSASAAGTAHFNTIGWSESATRTMPTGTSQWFMPTIAQWSMIVQGLTGSTTKLKHGDPDSDSETGTNQDYSADVVNRYIQAAGGTDVANDEAYWSSVEYEYASNIHFAWTMYFGRKDDSVNGYGFAVPTNKGTTDLTKSRVRTVLAF